MTPSCRPAVQVYARRSNRKCGTEILVNPTTRSQKILMWIKEIHALLFLAFMQACMYTKKPTKIVMLYWECTQLFY